MKKEKRKREIEREEALERWRWGEICKEGERVREREIEIERRR